MIIYLLSTLTLLDTGIAAEYLPHLLFSSKLSIVMGRRLITTTLYVPVNVPIEPPPLDIRAITIYTASMMATISICILTR